MDFRHILDGQRVVKKMTSAGPANKKMELACIHTAKQWTIFWLCEFVFLIVMQLTDMNTHHQTDLTFYTGHFHSITQVLLK